MQGRCEELLGKVGATRWSRSSMAERSVISKSAVAGSGAGPAQAHLSDKTVDGSVVLGGGLRRDGLVSPCHHIPRDYVNARPLKG